MKKKGRRIFHSARESQHGRGCRTAEHPDYTLSALGCFVCFFSKQEVQVQALLLKILSEMVPSQMGNPKRVSEELEQSFVSGAMYDKKPSDQSAPNIEEVWMGWKHDGQDLPLL